MAEVPSIQTLAKKVYMTPMQQQKVKASIGHLERTLKNVGNLGAGAVMPNVEQLEINLQRDQHMLESGTPETYNGHTLNQLNQLRQELERSFQSDADFLTHEDMERDIPSNVARLTAFERRNKQKVLAWKAVCRILDPTNDDVDFTSLYRLRSSQMPVGNPRRYRQGFDNIQWESQVEDTLLEQLDDSVYLRFLELRAAEWSDKTIMKQLGLTQALYDACVSRFHTATVPEMDDVDMYGALAGREPIPEPTPTGPVTETPAYLAAKAVGVEPPAVLFEEKKWPSSELPAGVSLTDLARQAKIPYMRIIRNMRDGSFKSSDLAVLRATLARIKKKYGTEAVETAAATPEPVEA